MFIGHNVIDIFTLSSVILVNIVLHSQPSLIPKPLPCDSAVPNKNYMEGSELEFYLGIFQSRGVWRMFKKKFSSSEVVSDVSRRALS